MTAMARFQSAPPGGGRHLSRHVSLVARRFNPRPRVGGDECAARFIADAVVSIRAPGWGATQIVPGVIREREFQSAPPGGGRRILLAPTAKLGPCFNPRPRVGGDARLFLPIRRCKRFNPRPRVGGDLLKRE